MTTKPKAKKFRIRRSAPLDGDGATDAVDQQPTPDAVPVRAVAAPAQPARSGDVASAAQVAGETDIDAIRREGLTGRQLRMARRVAQKHELAPTSDFDAVRLLRAKGIDPFKRSNMLELVIGDTEEPEQPVTQPNPTAAVKQELGRVQLPQTIVADKQTLPSTDVSPAERRAAEIYKVQRDIARRRRKKSLLLLTRLAFFVFLPTILAGWYFYAVATPMYATKSEFLILKADGGGGSSSFFSGTQFATSQDAIAVQSYLQSKDAMLRLDQDIGFKSHFTQDWIDPIQRLGENPSNEEAYKLYKRNIEIGFDPTEGVIKMEVTAANPEVSAQFSHRLIAYAEERVDNLSLRKRSNAVTDSEEGLVKAQEDRRNAQERLVRLQNEGAVLDPEARIAALRGQINNVEIQLQEKRLQVQALLDNARPNRSRVEGAQGDVRRLENLLDELNAQMTQASTGENSLAELAVQIQLAQADLAAANELLQAAIVQLDTSRREANSQARYLTTSVEPVPSQDASYPRSFENTILAFLIFAGIYLMISLTASILREQVTA